MPALPVLLESSVGNPFIVPPVSVPITISVISSPSGVYIKIKTWDISVIRPSTVIVMRAIPAAFPKTPPPAIPEKQVYLYIGYNIHIVCVRHNYHIRRCLKYDRWRQRYSNTYIYPCPGLKRGDKNQRQ
jgi:hypothetical protein